MWNSVCLITFLQLGDRSSANPVLRIESFSMDEFIVCLLLGPAFQLRSISIRTYVQDTLSQIELPKILSAQHTLSTFIYGMSILVMSTMTDLFGARVVFLSTLSCLLCRLS